MDYLVKLWNLAWHSVMASVHEGLWLCLLHMPQHLNVLHDIYCDMSPTTRKKP